MEEGIVSEEKYVWPYAKGRARGQSIVPLYPTVCKAVVLDNHLYELLALMDAVRVGRVREKLSSGTPRATHMLKNTLINRTATKKVAKALGGLK